MRRTGRHGGRARPASEAGCEGREVTQSPGVLHIDLSQEGGEATQDLRFWNYFLLPNTLFHAFSNSSGSVIPARSLAEALPPPSRRPVSASRRHVRFPKRVGNPGMEFDRLLTARSSRSAKNK